MAGTGGHTVASSLTRLEAVLAASSLVPAAPPVLLASNSNEAWALDDQVLGPVVLRICWRGDPERLLREAAVGRMLPAAVRYPTVLGDGRLAGDPDLTWSVTRRLDGSTLAAAWPGLDGGQRRSAGAQVAAMLEVLHGWQPPEVLWSRLVPAEPRPGAGVAGTIGRSLLPFPLQHVQVLLAAGRAGALPASLEERVRHYLEAVPAELVPRFDDREASGVLHSDVHLDNLWWHRGRVVLLDLEWVRLGPPYVELARLKGTVDADEREGLGGHRELYESIRTHYPALFEVPRLDERLRLVQVAYELRQLLLWPPVGVGQQPADDHPQQVLHRLLNS